MIKIASVTVSPDVVYTGEEVKIEVELMQLFPHKGLYPRKGLYPVQNPYKLYPSKGLHPHKGLHPGKNY